MSLPTFVNAGPLASGTKGCTPQLPADWQPGDLLLLLVETANQPVSLFGIHGYSELAAPGTGAAGSSVGTRLTVYWKVAGPSEVSPIVNDSGDHNIAVVVAFRDVDPIASVHAVASGTDNFGTTGVFPTVTTTVDNCLVIWALSSSVDSAAERFSNWVSFGGLTNLTERVDGGGTAGNGGGIGLATAEKPTAGSTGPGLVTTSASANGHVTVALAGV